MTAVRHIWQFDEAFTAFAIQGLDANGDGKLSDDELQPLAKVNVEFAEGIPLLHQSEDRRQACPGQFFRPKYWLDFHGGRLTLFYTLPIRDAGRAGQHATLEVFDPEYFVAFNFVKEHDDHARPTRRPPARRATSRRMNSTTRRWRSWPRSPPTSTTCRRTSPTPPSSLSSLITVSCPMKIARRGCPARRTASPPRFGRDGPRRASPFGIATPDGGGGFGWAGPFRASSSGSPPSSRTSIAPDRRAVRPLARAATRAGSWSASPSPMASSTPSAPVTARR